KQVPQFGKKFLLRGYFDQCPNRQNRVLKAGEHDRYGDQKARIVWDFTQRDKQSVIDHLSYLNQVLEKEKMGSIDFSTMMDIEKPWDLLNIHSHIMGTTRMGNDPKSSVTDSNGQIHGISNLYVSGPSLFPTYGHSNPFLTIVALAYRQSEILSTKYYEK
ncbi:MAG: GMC family oxidoreductase, partial [Bacteroidota bacterium]